MSDAQSEAQTVSRLKRWTADEDQFLGTAPDEEIARRLGRTRIAVTARRCELKIASANARGPDLSSEQRLQASMPDPAVLQELRAIEVPREALSREEEERFRLLHGPYYPPRTHRGAFLFCEWRGTVRVGGYSDAPIPWPYAMRTGYRSLILCGDLVRAVKLESELAVAYHWTVSATTVGKWRQVLGVEALNPGSRRLMWRAVDLARTPAAREKIAKAATGRSLSPEHRERLRALNRRPKSERFKRHMSEKMQERFASGKRARRWTAEEEALLGVMPDRELARRLGRSVGAVAERRFLKKQGAPDQAFSWTAEQDQIVGGKNLKEAAQLLQRSFRAVQARRRALGLSRSQPRRTAWTPQEDEIIRTQGRREAAQALGCSMSVVEKRRRHLGVARPNPSSRPWTAAEVKLLGTKPDRLLARKLKRRPGAVQNKRASLKIPPFPARHFWRPVDDNILGKYSDEDVARLLKVSVQAVAMRRQRLGIPRAVR
jgi:hypothetical protein